MPLRAQRGLDSGADVRVTATLAAGAAGSWMKMSPPCAPSSRRRAVSQRPLDGGAAFASSSESRFGRSPLAPDHVERILLLAGLPPREVEPLRIDRPAQVRRRRPDEIGPAHDAVDGQLEARRRGDGRAALRTHRPSGGEDDENCQDGRTKSTHRRLILEVSNGVRGSGLGARGSGSSGLTEITIEAAGRKLQIPQTSLPGSPSKH